MNSILSHSNERFSDLAKCNHFLESILNNITSCVLLLDKDMKLRAFNQPLKAMFDRKENENLLFVHCGEAIGCAYQVEEQTDCGFTQQCNTCELRIAALTTFATGKTVSKQRITRPFFNKEGIKIDKHLQFSTKLFKYKGQRHLLMIIDDVTDLITLEKERDAALEKSNADTP
jgi:sigma-B regulation protein RsbU (phosphoserine phosphatase)